MKKMITVILFMLLVFVGCKENTKLSVVDQNQTKEKLDVIDNGISKSDEEKDTSNEKFSDDKNEQDSQSKKQEKEPYSNLIKDNINELNDNVLKEIVQSYFIVFDFDTSFNDQDFVDYERAFHYMMSAGTYPIQPFEYWTLFENYYNSDSGNYTIPVNVVDNLILEKKIDSSWFTNLSINDDTYIVESADIYMLWSIRPELYQYFNRDTGVITVPANIVDEYILSKFNTSIDSSQIEAYDKDSNTYTYYPFTGSFNYDISIDEVIVDDKIVKFTSTLTNNIEDSPTKKYQTTFVIEFVDNEFKFLSIDIKNINL